VKPYGFTADYVRRLVEGDVFVKDHFTAYFGELLLIKLRGRLRTRDAIDEVRQEVFLRVLKKLHNGGIEHPERLGAFVNSVCNNVLLERFRDAERSSPLDPEVLNPPDPRMDLDALLIQEERKRLVHSVLLELVERDRDVIQLLFLEGLSRAEVSKRMGVDEDYLRVVVYRAISRFRERVEKRNN